MKGDSVSFSSQLGPEALILGGLGRKGYGVMRSLARSGVPVIGTTDQDSDPIRFSRYCRRCYSYPSHADGEDLCRWLLQCRSEFRSNPVLFAHFDHNAIFLAKYREELSKHFEYHWVPLEALLRIINKDQMSICCQQAGVLIPSTHLTYADEDLQRSVHSFSFPCLVKPIQKRIPGFPPGHKNFVAHTPKAMLEFYERHPGLKGVTIWQELVEGGDENNFVCAMVVLKSGKPAGVFCTRKLHQYPPHGVMCYGRSEWNEAVVSEALRLVRLLGYRGIASLEFKYQPKDGRYYFIEMNTRWPQYCTYYADAGVNLPYLTYLDLAGLADERAFQARQRNQVYWVHAHEYAKWFLGTPRENRPSLWQWLKSVAQADSYAFWNWRDPAPFFAVSLQTLQVGVQKLLRSFRNSLRRKTDSRRLS